jgi:hypothetical protein
MDRHIEERKEAKDREVFDSTKPSNPKFITLGFEGP